MIPTFWESNGQKFDENVLSDTIEGLKYQPERRHLRYPILALDIISFDLKEGEWRFDVHQENRPRPLKGEYEPVGNQGGSASLFYQTYALVIWRNQKGIPKFHNDFDVNIHFL